MNDWQVHPNVEMSIRLLEAAGWTLVPKEPTKAMIREGATSVPWPYSPEDALIAGEVWEGMLSKAPRPWAEEKIDG